MAFQLGTLVLTPCTKLLCKLIATVLNHHFVPKNDFIPVVGKMNKVQTFTNHLEIKDASIELKMPGNHLSFSPFYSSALGKSSERAYSCTPSSGLFVS